jgi:hypothetical protein
MGFLGAVLLIIWVGVMVWLGRGAIAYVRQRVSPWVLWSLVIGVLVIAGVLIGLVVLLVGGVYVEGLVRETQERARIRQAMTLTTQSSESRTEDAPVEDEGKADDIAAVPQHQAGSTLLATKTLVPATRPTRTPYPSPSPSLTPTSTVATAACTIQPTGAYVSLWASYVSELGCPQQVAPQSITAAEQLFQHGHMFWRKDLDVIYVVYDGNGASSGQWAYYGPEYSANVDEDSILVGCPELAPSGLVKPHLGFGNVWCSLGGTDADIGWALDQEYGFSPSLRLVWVQDFQRGTIFQDSDGTMRNLTYILFSTGKFVRTSP